jgi:aspartyl-tRNA(Asn)/glutamyl-tRNA(Gln) amidotransferase subunit A
VPAVDYVRALEARGEVYAEFKRTLRQVDFLVTPTTSTTAPRINDVLGRENGSVRSPLTHNTVYASYLGLPAVSVPSMEVGGLPLGLQIIGDKNTDHELLQVAANLGATDS